MNDPLGHNNWGEKLLPELRRFAMETFGPDLAMRIRSPDWGRAQDVRDARDRRRMLMQGGVRQPYQGRRA